MNAASIMMKMEIGSLGNHNSAFLLYHGPFAQHNAAHFSCAANCVGETDQTVQKRSGEHEIRTAQSLLSALKLFFKDNPTWE